MAELKKLQRNIRRLRKESRNILIKSLSTLQGEMVERIHAKGLNSNGGKIGTYSTKPISVSKKQQPRNTGKTFFVGGYKAFKSAVGLQSNYVTLELTGQMRQDFSVIPLSGKKAGLGFKNQENANKSGWMEDKYGTIYNPTKGEEKVFQRAFENQVNKIL